MILLTSQALSPTKPRATFFSSIYPDDFPNIKEIFGFADGLLSIRYLGVPIITTKLYQTLPREASRIVPLCLKVLITVFLGGSIGSFRLQVECSL